MAWKTEIGMIVRYLIGDVDYDNPTYDDDRLQETILVSSQLVNCELGFSYSIDVDECVLSPDPTLGTKDNGFINLVSLKAACIILNSEFRTAAGRAVNFVDGPSRIDSRDTATALKDLARAMCEGYEQAKKEYRAGNSIAGAAIVGPYRIYADGGFRHSRG